MAIFYQHGFAFFLENYNEKQEKLWPAKVINQTLSTINRIVINVCRLLKWDVHPKLQISPFWAVDRDSSVTLEANIKMSWDFAKLSDGNIFMLIYPIESEIKNIIDKVKSASYLD